MKTSRIAVIGAGVNGLACAVQILKTFPNVDVTIISDKFSPDTTTDVAAGIWGSCYLERTTATAMRKWGKMTLDYMKDLAMSSKANIVGAQLLSGYIGYMPGAETKSKRDGMDYSIGYRPLTEDELKLLPGCSTGWFYTSAQLEPGLYLTWLMKSAKELGARVIQRHVTSFEELEDFDLVLNCAGIGAKELTNDSEMISVRGQVTRVSAPWVKHFMVRIHPNDEEDYIIPGPRFCVLGGVFQMGRTDTAVDGKDHQKTLKGCKEVLPSLKNAKILKTFVGFRPWRPEVRLGKETIRTSSNKYLTVIHNYGHGGSGLTLHWGCAQDVLALVKNHVAYPTARL